MISVEYTVKCEKCTTSAKGTHQHLTRQGWALFEATDQAYCPEHSKDDTPTQVWADFQCVECRSCNTIPRVQIDRGGGLVRIRVDCESCGAFSHYLSHTNIQRGIKTLFQTLVPPEERSEKTKQLNSQM